MYCKNCGQQMNDNQAICLNCGVKTGVGEQFCPNCGKAIDANAAVCLNCGVNVKGGKTVMAEGNLNGKDKLTVLLLCYFLGSLGIHNFVMGEAKKGIVKIVASLCCGIGAILAIIDFFRIALDTYEADSDKLF